MNMEKANEIENIIVIEKTFQNILLEFLDNEDNNEEVYENIIQFFVDRNIYDDPLEIKAVLHLILKISKDHHRNITFFDKIEQILLHLKNSIKRYFTTYGLFNIFRSNKRILLFFIEKKIITIDQNIVDTIAHSSYKDSNYIQYFYPEIKNFLNDENFKQGKEFYEYDIENFDEKRKIGENDNHICKLIREDLIDEFISHVSQNNISPSSKVKESIYETNSYLLKKIPTLIEYSAFFGSTQIFKYLYTNIQMNNEYVQGSSLWLYSIHGRNPEIINFLEEKYGKLENELFNEGLIESIKCHHNEVSDYMIRNYSEITNFENLNVLSKSFKYYNFAYFPSDLLKTSTFYELCKYNHCKLVDMILNLYKIYDKCEINWNYILRTASNKGNKEIIQTIMRYVGIVEKSFQSCSSLIEITIPSSVRSIEDYAFSDCSSLKQITIPFSVTSIGKESFDRCSSLEQIIIPSSVTDIGEGCFYGCSSLKRASISSSLKIISDETFYRCSSLSQISIPSSVEIIGNSAFKCCSSLKQVVIPSSVKEIGENAFCWCSSLIEIKIPSSVKIIGKSAFSGCSSLTKVEIPPSINSIKELCFSFCSSLEKIIIPYSVLSIDDCAFLGCSSLTFASISSSVISIGEEAFSGCSSLKDISIPASVTEIEKDAFKGCSLLSMIKIPSSITSIGLYAFPSITKVIHV